MKIMERARRHSWAIVIATTFFLAVFIVLSVRNIPSILIGQQDIKSTYYNDWENNGKGSKEVKEVGRAADQGRPERRNVPPIPGANLLISVVDEQGQAVKQGTIEVVIEYQDFPDRNYQYTVDLASVQDGLLPLYPPPSHIPATASLEVITSTGGISDTLVIKNDEYWEAVEDTKRDFIGTHKFNLTKRGMITNVVYGK